MFFFVKTFFFILLYFFFIEISLNGFLYPEVTLLEEKVRSISDLLIAVEERSARMPDREVSERRSLICCCWCFLCQFSHFIFFCSLLFPPPA